jgi:hypothetical protein
MNSRLYRDQQSPGPGPQYSSSIEPHLSSGLALVEWLHGPEPQMPPPLSVVDGLFEMYHVSWGTLASTGGGGPRSGSDGEHV